MLPHVHYLCAIVDINCKYYLTTEDTEITEIKDFNYSYFSKLSSFVVIERSGRLF